MSEVLDDYRRHIQGAMPREELIALARKRRPEYPKLELQRMTYNQINDILDEQTSTSLDVPRKSP